MSHDKTDPPDDVEATLSAVRDNALQLLSAFPRPPSALRVQAGGVIVEAEWPVAAAPSGSIVPVTVAAATDAKRYLRAPAIGVFFQAPEPGAKPFVEVGDTVVAGQQVAIIEIMKLMIPVHADTDGRIIEVLHTNGAAVEYDEPLFAIAPLEP